MDEVEDSVEGARPLSLNLNDLEMTRVTSRVYGCAWLESLDLSRNRLYRVSPDMGALDNLINLDLRHNRSELMSACKETAACGSGLDNVRDRSDRRTMDASKMP